MLRPGEAKISPIKRIFITMERGSSERSPVPASVIDPKLNRGGAPRASLGFSMRLITAEACTPMLNPSRTPMTLIVGSIYWKPDTKSLRNAPEQ